MQNAGTLLHHNAMEEYSSCDAVMQPISRCEGIVEWQDVEMLCTFAQLVQQQSQASVDTVQSASTLFQYCYFMHLRQAPTLSGAKKQGNLNLAFEGEVGKLHFTFYVLIIYFYGF